jgi:tetratricopeptide (TPR) repeat protein
VALLAAACYAGTLGNGFVFDDRAILDTGSRPSLHSLPHLFLSPYWSGEGRANRLYRPLTQATFALEERWSAGRAWTFHLVNALLHALACVLLYLLVTSLFTSQPLAFAAAAIFAAHPVLSEAVAGIVGRSEILSALFILGALLAARRAASSAASPPLYFLALLSKENALAYPAVALLTDVLLGLPGGIRWRRRAWEMAALLAATGAYLALRVHVLGALMEPGSIPSVDNPLAHASAPIRIATALALTGRYFLLFLFPRHLSADYSFPQILPVSPLSLPAAAGAALALALGWAMLKMWRRVPALSWGLGFAACTFFLVSNLPFPIGTVFAERLLYLPSVGLCVAAACFLVMLAAKRPLAARGVLCGVLVLLGARTWIRARDWKDDFTLFKSAARVCPKSSKVRYNLANAYRRHGDLVRAAENYRLCLTLNPDFDSAKRNLGVTLTELGRTDEAIALLREALAKRPDSGPLHNNLGNALQAQGDLTSAEREYLRALQLDPGSADPHNNLANLYRQRGNAPKAEEEMREAVRRAPQSLPFRIHLGDMLLQRGRVDEALEVFTAAVGLDRESAEAQRGRGEALMRLGRAPEAIRSLQRSLELDSAQWEAPALLGYMSQQRGDAARAEQFYLRSLARNPAQPELRQNLGVVYLSQPGGREKAIEQFRLCLAGSPTESVRGAVEAMMRELQEDRVGKPRP